MIIRSGVLLLAALGLGACSSSDSDSPASPPTSNGPVTGDPDAGPTSGLEAGVVGADAPSNEELQATEGVVTVDEADALVPGRWVHTTSAAQCVQSVTFSSDGQFVENELDKVAGGFYRIVDEDGGTEISYDYTTDNGRVDCFGDNEQLVEEGVTFSNYVSFPDRDTMTLSSSPDGAGFARDFARQ